ncbi:unnamed protein product [Prunus brigantina]
MDKSWMHSDRRSKAYELGVEAFLNFSVENLLTTTHIRCPCVKCMNLKLFGVGIIRDHLYFNGVDQSYKNWIFHGEPWEATTNASRNVEEDDDHSRYSFVSEEIEIDDNDFGDFGSDPFEFANVIGDGDQPLYPGCRKWKEGKDSILKEGVPAKVFIMLTLLISDPKQPRNDIDVYLEPLIDDLKSLWDGIRGVYDAHNGEYFTLRAALMWTINDFPAYGNLSRCNVQLLMGNLNMAHLMVEDGDKVCWKKKSIFFDLEYWKYLPVRHVLDVMHNEKNVCDSIIATLLEIPGKNKDEIAA